jgi:hypothetical protein
MLTIINIGQHLVKTARNWSKLVKNLLELKEEEI